MTEQQLIYISRRRMANINWQTLGKEFELPWQELRKEYMKWVRNAKNNNDSKTVRRDR